MQHRSRLHLIWDLFIQEFSPDASGVKRRVVLIQNRNLGYTTVLYSDYWSLNMLMESLCYIRMVYYVRYAVLLNLKS